MKITHCLLYVCLLAPAAWGQESTTTTSAEIDTYETTNVTQQASTYQVELKARMQGGAYLYDQTFNVAFTDPSITAAITSAKSVLTGAGAVTFSGPTQLSSNQTLVSSVMNTVQTGSQVTSVLIGTGTWIGPATLYVGDRGICQSYAPAQVSGTGSGLTFTSGDYLQLTGCANSTSFSVAAGSEDVDTLATSLVTVSQTTTTTNTYLISQVYEIDGYPAGVPATPAPPTLLLLLIGLACAGLYAARRRLRS